MRFCALQVSGTSMLPHLQEGDWILTESFTSRFFPAKYPLKVGDVVVMKSQTNKEIQVVKRVIALVRRTFWLTSQRQKSRY
jgi:signal peptidase I